MILWGAGAPAQSFQGSWEAEFNHDSSAGTFPNPADRDYWPSSAPFNPEHLVLIPKGVHAGKVLMWDGYDTTVGSHVLRWSLLDPNTSPPTFRNFALLIDPGKGHLHCGGHAWADNGDLMVMGGENHRGAPTAGAKLAYRYVPEQSVSTLYGTWAERNAMVQARFYPSGVAFWDSMIGLFGGTNTDPAGSPDGARNTYEVYKTPLPNEGWQSVQGVRVWNGPQNGSDLGQLARLFQLSRDIYNGSWPLGRIFCVPKNTALCASVAHQMRTSQSGPGKWGDASQPAKLPPTSFHDTPVVLLPGETDVVVAAGGGAYSDKVQFIDMKSVNPKWAYMASLNTGRAAHNLVILPDGSLFAVRGLGATGPVYDSELYKNGHWIVINPDDAQYSPRATHSMAILLPNGKVLLAGGDGRTADYQLYSPWYLDGSCRAVIQSVTPTPLTCGTTGNTVYFEWSASPCPGVELQKVVLVAPGSVTHHFDQHQRYVELNVTQISPPEQGQPGWAKFDTPADKTYAPPGYYMMFLVTDGGIPSVATWVRLQP